MMHTVSTVLLWLLVINLGIVCGAGLYEHRIVASSWAADGHWNAAAAREDDTGRRFWVFVSTVPLTLLMLASFFVAWRAGGPVRGWWLAALLLVLADRTFTFSYFIPAMVRLMGAEDSPASAAAAMRWLSLNHVRHAIVLAAWLASLKAFGAWHAHHSIRASG